MPNPKQTQTNPNLCGAPARIDSAGWLVGWRVGWRVGWLIGRLVGWLAGWLVLASWLAGGFRVEGLELQTLQSVVRFLENHVKNNK